MQGYTYVKGEHYPVEHLIFETAPEHVQDFGRGRKRPVRPHPLPV